MSSNSRSSRLMRDRWQRRGRVAVESLERRCLLTGDPDLSFNPRGAFGPFPGAVATDFGSIFDEPADVAIQPGGPLPGGGKGQEHIVLAGSTVGGFLSFGDLALARYNLPDGSLDTSFGSGGTGIVTVNLGITIGGVEVVGGGLLLPRFAFTNDVARAMVIQDDRRIVVAGDVTFCEQFDDDGCTYTTTMAVSRFSADGALETSFSSRPGISAVLVGFGPSGEVIESQAHDVALQRVGGSQKILVAGSVDGDPDPDRVRRDFAIARLNSDGTIDTSFGTGGTMTVDFSGDDVAHGVAVQRDGKIVLVGSSRLGAEGSGEFRLALARLTPNGALDDGPDGFDGDGKLATTLGFGVAHGQDVAIQTVGGEERIVVAGIVASVAPPFVPTFNAVLARYRLDGSLIEVRSTELGTDNDEATSVVIDDQGRIVVAGSAGNSAAMLRYTPEGEPDPRFGTNGVAFGVRDSLGTVLVDANPRRIAIQPNGQIVLTGRTPAIGFGPPGDPPMRLPGVTSPAARGSGLPGGAVIGPRVIHIELPTDHDVLLSRYHSQCAPLAERQVVVVEEGVPEEILLVGSDCESVELDPFRIGPTMPGRGDLTLPPVPQPGMPGTPHTDTALVTYTARVGPTVRIDRFDFTVVDARGIQSLPATVRIIIAPGDCDRVWDGEAGDRSWHTPENWFGDVLPGPADRACIVDDVGAPSVTHRFGMTAIASLFSTVTIEIFGGTLALTDPAELSHIEGDLVLMADGTLAADGPLHAEGDLLMTRGTLTGAGEVTVAGTVQMTSAAIMSGNGRTIIQGTWEIGLPGGVADGLAKTIENRTVAVLGNASLFSGVLRMGGRATIENDGTFEFPTAGLRIESMSVDTAFMNRGTIVQSSAGNNDIQPSLDNPGTIEVRAGGLDIQGRLEQLVRPSDTDPGASRLLMLTAGTYRIAADATLGVRFRGELVLIKDSAATIVLSGSESNITTAGDSGMPDALADFTRNSGSFTIQQGRSFQTTPDGGEFENSGILTFGTAGSADPPDSNRFYVRGEFLQVAGGLTQVHPDGHLLVDGPIVFQAGSHVCGTNITSLVGIVIFGGTSAPGCSPGIMTVHGDLVQLETGVLEIELGGSRVGQLVDQLRVEGSVSLAGSLDVRLIHEFQPLAGDRFAILRNDGDDPISGTFAGLTEGAAVRVGPHRFRISYTGGDGNDVVLKYAGLVFAVFERTLGVLFVGGTDVAETMAVAPDPNAPNQIPAMRVFADGSPVPVIDSTGHPCKAASCPTAANTRQFAVQLADGDDRADVATLMGPGSKRLELLIHGGAGADFLRGQIGAAAVGQGSNAPPAMVGAVLVGDRGNDTIAFGYSGWVEVNFNLLANGGAGNDRLDVTIAPQAGQPNGNPNPPPGDPVPPPNPVPDAFYQMNVLGAAGNDDVTAIVSFSNPYFIVASIGIDLGAGNDRLALDLNSAAESLDLILSILAGSGNDNVNANVSAPTGPYLIVASIGIDLGAGNDRLALDIDSAAESLDLTLFIVAGSGNDNVTANLSDLISQSGSRSLVASIGIDLGAGNDRLALDLNSAAESLNLTLSILAGTGNDDVTALIGVTTPDDIVASIGIDLDAGNDTGNFQMARAGQSPSVPAPEVDVVLNILAGSGNDQFGAAIALGQVHGSLVANLFGESGNDSLALFIDAILDSGQGNPQALLDGGRGFDSCTASKNVTVRNCEQ